MSVVTKRLCQLLLAHIARIWVMLALGLGTAAFAAQSQTYSVTPSAVNKMIDKHGARPTVKKLTKARPNSEFGDFDIVLSGVSSGDPRWLALVPKLKAGTDASTSIALVVAVAEALPRNPRVVLRLIRGNPSWQRVCTYPMIEPSRSEQRTYFKQTIPALRSVRDPILLSTKNRCLTEILKAQRKP